MSSKIERRTAFKLVGSSLVAPSFFQTENGYPLRPQSQLALMGTTFVLAHGVNGSPDGAWFGGLINRLRDNNAKEVISLQFPADNAYTIDGCRNVIDPVIDNVEGDLVGIGWSAGARVWLDRLSRKERPIQGLILAEGRKLGVGNLFAQSDIRYSLYKDRLDEARIQANISGNCVIAQSINDEIVKPDNASPLAESTKGHIHWLGNKGHAEDETLDGYFYDLIISEIMRGIHVRQLPLNSY